MKYTILRTILFMSQTALIGMIVTCLAVNLGLAGNSTAQSMEEVEITISAEGVSVGQLFSLIEHNTSFYFLLNDDRIEALPHRFTIEKKQQSVADILRNVALETGLQFRQINNTISVRPGRPAKKQLPLSGVIRGTVTDAETGDPLAGATIQIKGTTQGVAANGQGRYELPNMDAGTYTLVFSFVSYQQAEVEVEVRSGETAEVDVALRPAASQMEEVVVQAEYAPINYSTEVSMIQTIAETPNIVTGISNQQIARSLDRNAADVVKRIPGVSTLNNFVLVRGLDPRYTLTYINNLIAPSSEKNRRVFSFGLIPSGIIDQILIYKSPAPELPGQFAGGVVKVKTKDALTARRLQIRYSTQYRTGGSSLSNIKTNSGSGNDGFLGLDYKNRLYDDRLYVASYNFPDLAAFPTVNAELTRNFPAAYNLEDGNHGLDRRFGFNYYDSWKIGKSRLSNLTSASYTGQLKYRRQAVQKSVAPVGYSNSGAIQIPEAAFTDSLYNNSVRFNVLESLTYKFNDRHRLAFDGYFNRSIDDKTGMRDGYTQQMVNNIKRRVNYEYSVKDIYTLQLEGDHELSGHNLHWYGGISKLKEISPDLQTYTFENVDSTHTYGTYRLARTIADRTTRRGSFETDESGILAGLDYHHTLNNKVKIKAGAQVSVQDRLFESYYYFPSYNGNSNGLFTTVSGYKPWERMSEIINDTLITSDPENTLYLQRDFSESRYSIDYRLYASYLGVEVPLFDEKFQINGGVRYERTERHMYDNIDREILTSEGYHPLTDEPEGFPLDPVKEFWLPSASVTWNLTSDMKLRATYGRTLDRPAFRELSYITFYDFENSNKFSGYPGLDDAAIDNFDMRWEWYSGSGEFIAAGVFYKHMRNVIEILDNTNPGSQTGFTSSTYINTPRATSKGVEVEIRKNLGFLPLNPARYFSVIANYTYLINKVDLDEETGTVYLPIKDRPFFGSSPYVINTGLYFDQPKWGTNISVLFNRIGQRLLATGRVGERGYIYLQPTSQLDLVFSQKITTYLKIKMGAENVLNQPVTTYMDSNYDGEYDPGLVQLLEGTDGRYVVDYEKSSYKPGIYYSFGVTFEF